MNASYDPRSGAAYVELAGPIGAGEIVRTLPVTDDLLLDYDVEGALRGIELLAPKPRPELAETAAKFGFASQLDRVYRALDMACGVSAIGWSLTFVQVSV